MGLDVSVALAELGGGGQNMAWLASRSWCGRSAHDVTRDLYPDMA